MKRKNILLLALVLVAAFLARANAGPSMRSGVEGTIVISPVRGGPLRMGTSDSKPLAMTEFVVQKDGQTVASFQTDDAGKFHLPLAPGHYTVARKAASGIGFFGPFDLDVTAGKMKSVQWKCDSGAR